jgi:FMN phosphatase YigB (HAD superfamily)
MYELGAQRIGAEPRDCVFVDDLAFNLDPARELGMAVVHHTSAQATLAELGGLVGPS